VFHKHFGILLISSLVADFSKLVAQSESAVSPKASAECEFTKNTSTESTLPSPLLKAPENNVDMSTLSENKDSDDISLAFAKNGFYVTPQFGGAVVQDVNFVKDKLPTSITSDGTSYGGGSVDASLGFDAGFRFDVSIGFKVNDWFSVEFAPGVIVNPMNSVSFTGQVDIGNASFGGVCDIDGNLIQVPLLVNFIFTIPTNSKWEPFVGGGVGALYSSATFNNISGGFDTTIYSTATSTSSTTAEINSSPVTIELNESATCWALGYSALAGVGYHFSRDISIGFIYKFTGTGAQNFGVNTFGNLMETNGTFTQSVQADATFSFRSHNSEILLQ
jgi:opacity protein-like surface antigen